MPDQATGKSAAPRGAHREKAAFEQAFALYRSHDYARAERLFDQIRAKSAGSGDREYELKALISIANCRFLSFKYGEALRAYEEARILAHNARLESYFPIVESSTASVYLEMGDMRSAAVAVDKALAGARSPQPESRPFLLYQAAEVYARQGSAERAGPLYREGIEASYEMPMNDEAARARALAAASFGWDHWGGALLLFLDRPREAERPLLEAFRIRKLTKDPNLRFTVAKLARLAMQQGDVRLATVLLDSVKDEIARAANVVPPWYFHYLLGLLHNAQGRKRDALRELGSALEWADRWGLQLVSAESIRAQAGVRLDELFDVYIDTALSLDSETPNPELSAAIFAATERIRAWSLRQALRSAEQLPASGPRTAELLSQLRNAEIESLQTDSSTSRARVLELRRYLAYQNTEKTVGVLPRENLVENNSGQNTLIYVQRHLGDDEALLTFHRSANGFLRCGVTRTSFSLNGQIAGNGRMEQAIESFRRGLAEGRADREEPARELYRLLFGQLPPEIARKPRWYLVLDDALFQVPFGALVSSAAGDPLRYLVEDHSTSILPGAWTLGETTDLAAGEQLWEGAFVGIGDPIYNRADPRYTARRNPFPPVSWTGGGSSPIELSRLASSGTELQRCARGWELGETYLLTGADAVRRRVAGAAAASPAVLHFATHVLESPDPAMGSYIVLSLGSDGRPDLLGSQEISRWQQNCSLVVLNGCNSAAGETISGSGLMGLTRSWLVGGARSVLATHWAIPDDTGDFFEEFYRNLASYRHAGGSAPAEAMQQAQISQLRSHSWRSDPRYWAAYFLIGRR